MKIVAISDTHGLFDYGIVPQCDILCHSGDLTLNGTEAEIYFEIKKLLGLLEKGITKNVVFIAGNHDFDLQDNPTKYAEYLTELQTRLGYNINWLHDSGLEINGVKFWGSPWTPQFLKKNRPKLPALLESKWSLIPSDTDVLLTHGPSYGRLDKVKRDGSSVGCKKLLERIDLLPFLRYHLFGHIHEEYGELSLAKYQAINSSVNTAKYKPKNVPIVFEI